MDHAWDIDIPGVVELPSGRRICGMRLKEAAAPDVGADLVVQLACRMPIASVADSVWIKWCDFRAPSDQDAAVHALRSAHGRAATERVVVACAAGVGRTGTALAAMAVLEGQEPDAAVAWVRRTYHRRAVELPWQRSFLRRVAGS